MGQTVDFMLCRVDHNLKREKRHWLNGEMPAAEAMRGKGEMKLRTLFAHRVPISTTLCSRIGLAGFECCT